MLFEESLDKLWLGLIKHQLLPLGQDRHISSMGPRLIKDEVVKYNSKIPSGLVLRLEGRQEVK